MNPAIKYALDAVKQARTSADARRTERQAELYALLQNAKAVATERAASAQADRAVNRAEFPRPEFPRVEISRADIADRAQRVSELVGEQLQSVEKQAKDAAVELEKRSEKGKKQAKKKKKVCSRRTQKDAKRLNKQARKQAKKQQKELKASAADAAKRGKKLLGIKEKKKNKGASTAIGLLVTAAVAAVVGFVAYNLFANKLPVSNKVPRVDDTSGNAGHTGPVPSQPSRPQATPTEEAPARKPGTPVEDSEVPADENPVQTNEAAVNSPTNLAEETKETEEIDEDIAVESAIEKSASEQDRVVTPINRGSVEEKATETENARSEEDELAAKQDKDGKHQK